MSEVVEQIEESESTPKAEKKSLVARLEEEGDVAADYLEALLDITDTFNDQSLFYFIMTLSNILTYCNHCIIINKLI